MDQLGQVFEPLNTVLFVLGEDHVSAAELLGFLTGAACVWLTVKARVSNFPVGIANSAFFLILFMAAHLYADSGLQAVYIGLGFVGWWQWLHLGARRNRLEVARAGAWTIVLCVFFTLAVTAGLTRLLSAAHDVAPFWDAITAAISLAAQFLLNCKRIENWAFWIAADLIYVPLYIAERLDLTAGVYLLFLGLCLMGLTAWHRVLLRSPSNLPGELAGTPRAGPS